MRTISKVGLSKHLASSGVVLGAIIGSATPTLAADESAEPALQEIIVTARQRAEVLEEVPASITAFTAEEIQLSGVERPQDFIRLTPGVSMTQNVEVGDFSVSIRGLNKARDGEQNFAFLVDGVLLTNPTAFNREFADIEQILVMKGPQGATYGRSASAGAIIVSTAKPTATVEGGVQASAGNLSTFSGGAYLSGPLVEGKLVGRLSANYRTTDGYYDNLFRDTRVDDLEEYGVRGRLVWTPREGVEVDAKVNYAEVPEAGGIWFNQSFGFFENVNDHGFRFFHGIDPLNEQQTFETSVKVDYQLPGATLTAWALYSDIDNFIFADGTFAGGGTFNAEPICIASTAEVFASGFQLPLPSFLGPTPATSALMPFYGPTTCDGYQMQRQKQNDYSFEVRLTSPSDQPFRWQGGLYFLDIDRTYGLTQGLDTGDGKVIRELVLPGRTETLIHSKFDTQVLAGFGHVFYDIRPNLEIALGLRWDQEKRDIQSLVPPPSAFLTQYVDFVLPIVPGSGGSPLNPAFGFISGQISDSIPDREASFVQWQPKVSLRWDVTDDTNIYSSWGIGFKSGGFNATGIAEIIDLFLNGPIGQEVVRVNDVFEKEVTSAFELGAKSRLAGGMVSIDGAVFYTEVDDMQFFEFLVGPFGVIRSVSNIDKVDIQGAEIGFDVRPNRIFSIFGGASLVDSEIKSNLSRPNSKGNKAPYAPEWTANIGADLNLPTPIRDVRAYARLDWSIVGPTWFHVIQDQAVATVFGVPQDYSNTRRDQYETANLRVGLKGSQWSLFAYGRNLFDEKYLDEVIPVPEFAGSNISPGARRTYGIEARYTW